MNSTIRFLIMSWIAATSYLNAQVKHIDPSADTGTSKAVVVRDSALAHTSQLLPVDRHGSVIGEGDAVRQTEQVLSNLALVLKGAESDLSQVVKLNVYAVNDVIVATVQKVIASRFKSLSARPAISFVTGKLADPHALVSMDAVAVSTAKRSDLIPPSNTPAAKNPTYASILPVGSKVFVSGQAEKGTLLEATRKTMESLSKTLVHLGLNDSDIVQLKAFLMPMSSVKEVEEEIVKYFGSKPTPPLVFVEWNMPTPIEIELVAAGGPAKSSEPLEFITPPDMKASPIYCRVVCVNRDPIIFLSGLYGKSSQDGKAEVTEIYDNLKTVLTASGSDLLHLVKATYYVSDTVASNELNAQRPRYYDPARPPAASKAVVSGVGMTGKTITIDMIAVGK